MSITNEKPIDANPTKELFISYLVKDIKLRDAIGDLVDNSVDAAKKNSKSDKLGEFEIVIRANKDFFEIVDNCGGLEAKDAKTSAFCFGKPIGYKPGKNTIGQFGIGMKRAFFKIGNLISVESIAKKSSFKMHIDVSSWQNDPQWNFDFDEIDELQNNKLKNTKTKIKIEKLNPDAASNFADNESINILQNEIALEQIFALHKGIKIEINGYTLTPPKITLIEDENSGIRPVYWSHKFDDGLNAEILAGISEDSGSEGGWYIFCNERLILGPDTTEKTGWTGSGGNELPKYHDQYFRFRGYVFFSAEDSSRLPWNTTKTGMDLDSPDFLHVRSQMIIIGKQVKKFMDDMKKERERGNPEEKQMLNNVVKKASLSSVMKVMQHKTALPTVYKYPEGLLNIPPKNTQGAKITFYKPAKVINKVKAYFNTLENDVAGERAFDYFYDSEIDE